MNVRRTLVSCGLVISMAAFAGPLLSIESHAQGADKPIVGGWTRNRAASDTPDTQGADGNDGQNDGQRGQGGQGRGGGGRGGGGRGGGRRGGGGGFGGGAPNNVQVDRDAQARMQDAIRDIMNPPDHLIIVQTDTMVIMTGPDGRATRFLPDNKKIKDDNTGIERKTRWDGARLVCEVSGAGPGKITQTYSVDSERHQLRVVIQRENNGGRPGLPQPIAHVYDGDAR